MENHEALLREVFGDSSSDGEDDGRQFEDSIEEDGFQSTNGQNPSWERIKQINGLWFCRDFLSSQQQSSLLSALQNESLFAEGSHNQVMKFGNFPPWASELSGSVCEAVLFSDHAYEPDGDSNACPLPSDILWREPLFDQLIINVYQPGEGICAHIDLMRFEDGIAIVSLESPCVMHFSRIKEGCDISREDGERNSPVTKVPVYLTPGSLVLMSGEARYLWKHEINRQAGFQMWRGRNIDQKRRTSITLRKLCQVE